MNIGKISSFTGVSAGVSSIFGLASSAGFSSGFSFGVLSSSGLEAPNVWRRRLPKRLPFSLAFS
ncbi:hypothetical protein [Allobaculum sp. Allo2]|uniref:hypothetical protein n=1 Tax=Allobaculum sp. Allo2 TaxID=2853432 RepID=UPI001F623414|nr:hypothetical protein [Allobaculum sp. Allo2]UNT92713.1 hypothetical protein KWG61_11430 [Allobaculum sp. Allo2]